MKGSGTSNRRRRPFFPSSPCSWAALEIFTNPDGGIEVATDTACPGNTCRFLCFGSITCLTLLDANMSMALAYDAVPRPLSHWHSFSLAWLGDGLGCDSRVSRPILCVFEREDGKMVPHRPYVNLLTVNPTAHLKNGGHLRAKVQKVELGPVSSLTPFFFPSHLPSHLSLQCQCPFLSLELSSSVSFHPSCPDGSQI